MKLTISLITRSAIIYFYIYHQQSQLGAFFSVVHYFLSSLCCVLMHKKNECWCPVSSSSLGENTCIDGSCCLMCWGDFLGIFCPDSFLTLPEY